MAADAELALRLAFLALAAVGFGVAVSAPRVGGAVAFVGGCVTGGLAVFAEHLAVAAVAGFVLTAPAMALTLGGWRRAAP